MLRELRSVIAVRAEETREREERALSRKQTTSEKVSTEHSADRKDSAETVDETTESAIHNDDGATEESYCTTSQKNVTEDRPASHLEENQRQSSAETEDHANASGDNTAALAQRVRSAQGFPFASHVALEAVAKSREMHAACEDTFGDSDDD